MIVKKIPIGILDMALDSISILNALAEAFSSEHFIYVNDMAQKQYEGLPVDEILKHVQANVQFLIHKGVKLIVVMSNTIVEYCRDYFDMIEVPVVNIVDSIINSVNDKYEHKNMAFLATESILQANIYQKNLRYNHLYNIAIDRLDAIVLNKKTKTNESFMTTKEILKSIIKRDVDIIIPTHTNLMFLSTEIFEFMRESDLLDLPKIIIEKMKAALLTTEHLKPKGRGKIEVYFNVPYRKHQLHHLLKTKYTLKRFNSLQK